MYSSSILAQHNILLHHNEHPKIQDYYHSHKLYQKIDSSLELQNFQSFLNIITKIIVCEKFKSHKNCIQNFRTNGVSLSGYQNNSRKISKVGWYDDNDMDMNTNIILSYSVGADALFQVRNNKTKIVHETILSNHDFCLMLGKKFQRV